MKLEDITLKNGDIVTKIDGRQTHVNLENDTYFTETIYDNVKDKITKIERYEPSHYITGEFTLKTIWERKEELNKEELQQQISTLQRDIDLLSNDISTYYSKIISARDKVGYIRKELSKIQSEVNK